MVFAGDRAGDGELSGASHAVQPKDVPFIAPTSPCSYLFEDVDSCFGEAERVAMLVI
jgi:hypothetical protein